MKRKTIIVMLLVVIMALSVLLNGCSSPSSQASASASAPASASQSEASGASDSDSAAASTAAASEDKPLAGKRIAIAHITLYDEWCKSVADELESQGAALGAIEVNVQDPNFSLEKQVQQVDNFIVQKYDMLIIAPTDVNGIISELEKVTKAGIPIIEFGQYTTYDKTIARVQWDYAGTGKQCADYIADYATKNLGGKVKVGLLEMLSISVNKIRGDAFKTEIEAKLGKDNVTYVYDQDFGSSEEDATKVVQNNIAKPCDFIFACVDNAAFGARVALETNKVSGTKIVSCGGWGTRSFSTIANNDPYYIMCIAVPPKDYVEKIYENVVKYFNGTQITQVDQNSNTAVVDASNINDYKQYIDESAAEAS